MSNHQQESNRLLAAASAAVTALLFAAVIAGVRQSRPGTTAPGPAPSFSAHSRAATRPADGLATRTATAAIPPPAVPGSGVVLRPDGSPAAGAEVYRLAGADATYNVGYQGALTVSSFGPSVFSKPPPPHLARELLRTKATRDGGFHFPPRSGDFVLLAASWDGFCCVTSAALRRPAELKLVPWGHVEGTCTGRGGARRPLECVTLHQDLTQPGFPGVSFSKNVWTGLLGGFDFDWVPAGPVTVARRADQFFVYEVDEAEAHVPAGGTAKVELRTVGSRLRGSVAPGPDVNWKRGRGGLRLQLRRPAFPRPPGWASMARVDQEALFGRFLVSSAESRSYYKSGRSYPVAVSANGTFSADGIAPGTYDLAVELYDQGGKESEGFETPTGKASRVVMVPPAADGAEVDAGALPVRRIPRIGDDASPLEAALAGPLGMKPQDLRGHYVVVQFWATWCESCERDLPAMKRLFADPAASDRLLIVGVNIDDDKAEVPAYLRKHAVPWKQAELHGPALERLRQACAVDYVPLILLIDPSAKLVGYDLRDDRLAGVVRSALDKQP